MVVLCCWKDDGERGGGGNGGFGIDFFICVLVFGGGGGGEGWLFVIFLCWKHVFCAINAGQNETIFFFLNGKFFNANYDIIDSKKILCHLDAVRRQQHRG